MSSDGKKTGNPTIKGKQQTKKYICKAAQWDSNFPV